MIRGTKVNDVKATKLKIILEWSLAKGICTDLVTNSANKILLNSIKRTLIVVSMSTELLLCDLTKQIIVFLVFFKGFFFGQKSKF